MLIITGASGKLGGLVVEALLRPVTADQIGVGVRDPEKLAELSARGLCVGCGDDEDADSLRHAWEGASRVGAHPPEPPASPSLHPLQRVGAATFAPKGHGADAGRSITLRDGLRRLHPECVRPDLATALRQPVRRGSR